MREIFAFVSWLLIMNDFVALASIHGHLWSISNSDSSTVWEDIFSKHRFTKLKRYFHVSDPRKQNSRKEEDAMMPCTRLGPWLICYQEHSSSVTTLAKMFQLMKLWFHLKSDFLASRGLLVNQFGMGWNYSSWRTPVLVILTSLKCILESGKARIKSLEILELQDSLLQDFCQEWSIMDMFCIQ